MAPTVSPSEQKILNLLSGQSSLFYQDLVSYHVCLRDDAPSNDDRLEDNFRAKFTSQYMYDASDMHLERSFRAYDKDADSTLDADELLHGLETGSGFDFSDYPVPFVKVLGLLCNQVLDDERAKEISGDEAKRKTFLKGWGISYILYRELVKQLKFHILFHPRIIQKMFKKTRFTRLMAQSPAIRFLRKLEMRKNSQAKDSKQIQKLLSRTISPGSERGSFFGGDTGENEDDDFWEDVSAREWMKYMISLDLIFTDVNTIQDQVTDSSVNDLNRATHDMGVALSVQDYSIDSLVSKRHINKDFETLREFMSKDQRPEGTKVRWINAEQCDILTILRVASMQRIHPLATKDIMEPFRQPVKITEFGSHFLTILPCIRLSRKAKASLARYRKILKMRSEVKAARRLKKSGIIRDGVTWLNSLIQKCEEDIKAEVPEKLTLNLDVESSRAVVLMASEYDTLMTFSTLWMRRKEIASAEDIDSDSDSDSDDEDGFGSDSDDDDEMMDEAQIGHDLVGTFSRQHKYLKRDFSFIRCGDANYLLCSILRSMVSDMQPIVDVYRIQLEIMQDSLSSKRSVKGDKGGFLRKVHWLQREIEWVERKVKPLKRIVRHLIDDKRIGSEISQYFEDIEDDVATCQDDLRHLTDMIAALKAEYDNFHDRRVNELLSVLTFATVCILPAQFLTGLYGMNFQDDDGGTTMPELKWKNGYLIFWVVSLVTMIGSFVYFKFVWRVL
mmetsp:Transcript_7015/g.14211  ORF Transcript_7015/g.14211 Transcript_7015/m.14211 type:complete len:729 (+) Transcript_7015:102-2288(+)